MTDAERAAVGYLATSIGTDCDWDGKPGNDLKCKLTWALDLGYQCSDQHRQYLEKWLGDDRPDRCVKRPSTAFTQTAFQWLTITSEGETITLHYETHGASLQDRRAWTSKGTLVFVHAAPERLELRKHDHKEVENKKLPGP